MLTLRAETIDDIKAALSQLGRLPRRQRVNYLAKAKRKLLGWGRKGYNVDRLRMRVHRLYADEKKRLDEKKARPTPSKQTPYDVVDKNIYKLEVGEATRPPSERYRGLLVVHSPNGWYATDGEKRTRKYGWSGAIPDEEIEALVDPDNTNP